MSELGGECCLCVLNGLPGEEPTDELLPALQPFLGSCQPAPSLQDCPEWRRNDCPTAPQRQRYFRPRSLRVSCWHCPRPHPRSDSFQESPGSPLTPTHTCRAHGELLTEPSSVDSSAAWRTGVRPLRITKPEKMQLGSLQKLVFQTSPQNFIRSFEARRQIRAYFLQHMGSPRTRVPIQQCGPPSPSSPVLMTLQCPPASLCFSTA